MLTGTFIRISLAGEGLALSVVGPATFDLNEPGSAVHL